MLTYEQAAAMPFAGNARDDLAKFDELESLSVRLYRDGEYDKVYELQRRMSEAMGETLTRAEWDSYASQWYIEAN